MGTWEAVILGSILLTLIIIILAVFFGVRSGTKIVRRKEGS